MKYIKRNKSISITDTHLELMGLTSTQQINQWYINHRTGRYWIKDLDTMISIVLKYISKYIYIFGDYDVDGISATSIMLLALHRKGFKNLRFRIPHRFSEGFGLNCSMVDEIKEPPEDVLIITVDNGIAAIEPIAYAKEKGFTVIVTDHHKPFVNKQKEIIYPNADLIINPNAIPNSATFNGYCGAGLAFKIAQKLLAGDQYLLYLESIAALATVCDQMKLEEENYVFVRDGLSLLNQGCALPGMIALGETMGVSQWTADFMGYKAGPCINAPERMDDGAAGYGVHLLVNSDIEKCRYIAQGLKTYNSYRIEAVSKAMEKVDIILDEQGKELGYPILLYVPDVSEGIIGILSGKVQERYGYPCGVFSDSEEGVLKGSFRAPDNYNIKEHLDMVAHEFIGYGGHEGAGAGSVKKDNFNNLCKALTAVSSKPESKTDESDIFYYDVEITDRDVAASINENMMFAPFGNGNPDLVFKITGFDVVPDKGDYKKQIGGNGVRIKSPFTTAVGFGLWDEVSDIDGPCRLTFYGNICNNFYNGKNYPQIQFLRYEIESNSKTSLAQKFTDMAKKRYM